MPGLRELLRLREHRAEQDHGLVVQRRAEPRVVVRAGHPHGLIERAVRGEHVAVEVAGVGEDARRPACDAPSASSTRLWPSRTASVLPAPAIDCESSGIIVTSTTSLARTSSTATPSPAWICAPRSSTSSVASDFAESAPVACASSNSLLRSCCGHRRRCLAHVRRPFRAGCPASWRSGRWSGRGACRRSRTARARRRPASVKSAAKPPLPSGTVTADMQSVSR